MSNAEYVLSIIALALAIIGLLRIGGWAPSHKSPTDVTRIGAYTVRYDQPYWSIYDWQGRKLESKISFIAATERAAQMDREDHCGY